MGKYRIPFEPDSYYHIYNHGNAEDNIFRNDGNYKYFLKRFAEQLNGVLDTYAYCLMPNHFHFLVQIKNENELISFFTEKKKNQILENDKFDIETKQGLIEKIEVDAESLPKLIITQISNFLNGYTQAFNKQHNRRGSLFLDNIQRKLVESDAYFTTLIHYIHSNPVHHGFTTKMENWLYSSYHTFFSDKPSRLQRQKVIDWFGSVNEFKSFHVDAKDFEQDNDF